MAMRTVHRTLSIVACLVLLYLGVTGSIIQGFDLRERLGGAPEATPVMQSINEGKNGNFDYAVVSLSDYAAKPLPTDLNVPQAFRTVLAGLRRVDPAAGPTFVELRMAGDRPIGQARFGQAPHDPGAFGEGIRAVDARTGAAVAAVDVKPVFPAPSWRQSFKEWHRMWIRNDIPGVYVELLAGIAMWVLIVTGLVMYFRLLKQRRKIKKPQMFWMTSDRWRGWHRGVSVAAAILLVVVAFSGTWLGFESVWHTFVRRAPDLVVPPLADDDVLRMADATMAAARRDAPGVPLKVIRLRDYAGMKQGIVVTDEPVTRQLVFDTATGRRASLTERTYPVSGFPLGLEVHEFMKHLHSGFLFGAWARLLDLLAGLALVFLSVSGLVMYLKMYNKRRRANRMAFFWK